MCSVHNVGFCCLLLQRCDSPFALLPILLCFDYVLTGWKCYVYVMSTITSILRQFRLFCSMKLYMKGSDANIYRLPVYNLSFVCSLDFQNPTFLPVNTEFRSISFPSKLQD